MSADNTQETSQTTDDQTQSTGKKDVLAERLSQVEEQLRAFNESMTQTAAAIQSMKPKEKEEVTDDNLYDPSVLLNRASQVMDNRLREERKKDATIYELSQEYPEIKTDQKIRNDILAAQKALPDSLRDTAEGYEMAVLKAVSKAGIVGKSKRQTVDEDLSMGSGGSSSQNRQAKRKKLSDATLMVAQLMGRDINDPETIKRLEDAANRDTYNKYR